MWKIMHHYGLSPKLIALLENLYKRAESAVIVGQDITDWFKQTVGVRQGCIVSPDLFNLYLEHVLRVALSSLNDAENNNYDDGEDEHRDNAGASIGGRRVNNLRFADDIALISTTLQEAQKLLDKVSLTSDRYGQEISQAKTEWMRARPKAEAIRKELIKLNGEPLKQVETFKYLGANIAANGDCTQDIRIRTSTALRSMADLSKTWRGRGVSIATKMRLYRALIQPIALYGCETWTLTEQAEKKLLVFEMSALRTILGVRRLDKIRNEEIRSRVGCTTTLVQLIYGRQHKWLGHVLRMDDARIAKTVLQGKVQGTRRRGKPRTTWASASEERSGMSLHQATELAQNRGEWRAFGQIVGAHVRPTRLKKK
jgi:hypothetical protein